MCIRRYGSFVLVVTAAMILCIFPVFILQRDGDSAMIIIRRTVEIMYDESIFENDLLDCPYITVGVHENRPREPPLLKKFFTLYSKHPVKACVPVVKANIQLNETAFTQEFRSKGAPVKFRFDNLRDSGFPTQEYSLMQLREMFPYNGKPGALNYKPNSNAGEQEIDLGPGLAELERDSNLIRTPGMRNFPRNMRVHPNALKLLNVARPNLVAEMDMQKPSLWMGTSSSGTPFHSDCCDNFIMMVSGTKRVTLAPPTDFYKLKPACYIVSRGYCYATNPTNPSQNVDYDWNRIVVDVKQGEILFIPANWFHHIQNLGPTVMVNVWTSKSKSQIMF